MMDWLMSAQGSLSFSWCFPAMGTICNNRNACLTARLLRFDAVPPTGCSIMSAFVFLLGIVPAAEYLRWRLLSSSIQLVPGRQTDRRLSDRQTGGDGGLKILSVVWDRPRARKLFKDSRVSSTLPVTKLQFRPGRETKPWQDSEEHRRKRGASGDADVKVPRPSLQEP